MANKTTSARSGTSGRTKAAPGRSKGATASRTAARPKPKTPAAKKAARPASKPAARAKAGTAAKRGAASKVSGKAKPAANTKTRGPTKARAAASTPRRGTTAAAKRPAAPARAARSTKAAVPAPAKKVGSSRKAAAEFADRKDFGTPAAKAAPRGRGRDSAEGLPRNEQGRSGDAGDRTHGVGSAPSGPGSGSGGDLDTDFVGVGISPVAQDAPTAMTAGPASTTGGPDEFDRGGPARGENALPTGSHGAAPLVRGSTLDHTGDDADTVRGGLSAEAADDGSDLTPGELTRDEASGADNTDTDNRAD